MLPIFYDFVLFRDSCILKYHFLFVRSQRNPGQDSVGTCGSSQLFSPPRAELPFPPPGFSFLHNSAILATCLPSSSLGSWLALFSWFPSRSPLPLSSFSLALPCPTSLTCLLVKFSLDPSQCLLLNSPSHPL